MESLPTEAWGAFLEQMAGLESAVEAAQKQMQVLRGRARCAQAEAQKTCGQVLELGETLQSSEEEVLRAASALSFLVRGLPQPCFPWSLYYSLCPSPSLDCYLWFQVLFTGCLVSANGGSARL